MPHDVTASTLQLSRPWLILGAIVAALLAVTAGLWMHYGTVVFYEMIVAGLEACL